MLMLFKLILQHLFDSSNIQRRRGYADVHGADVMGNVMRNAD
jgi:hypothetical protein